MFHFKNDGGLFYKKCDLKRFNIPVEPTIFKTLPEIYKKLRSHLYTYFFSALLSLVFKGLLISSAL